jgi:hypothetical protein
VRLDDFEVENDENASKVSLKILKAQCALDHLLLALHIVGLVSLDADDTTALQ